MRKLKIAGVWLLQGLMALAMTGSGIEKFTDQRGNACFVSGGIRITSTS